MWLFSTVFKEIVKTVCKSVEDKEWWWKFIRIESDYFGGKTLLVCYWRKLFVTPVPLLFRHVSYIYIYIYISVFTTCLHEFSLFFFSIDIFKISENIVGHLFFFYLLRPQHPQTHKHTNTHTHMLITFLYTNYENECLGKTLNWMQLTGSSLGALGSLKYNFIAITPRSTLTQGRSTWFIGQIDLFKNNYDSQDTISSSSWWCRVASTDIPAPLSPRLPIIHRLWQVFGVTSRIIT